jgi:pyroglutamyl-peptidase
VQPIILATGFSVFPGAPENPTAWAMTELERSEWQPDGARLVTRVLPVRFDVWETELRPLLAVARPDAVVAFGLSAKATGVTLESTARNGVTIERPDFAGAHAASERLAEDGPEVCPTRLPLRDIAAALKREGVPFERSDDAGDYICNLLFYRLMEHADAGGPKIAGFIHVPYLDTQKARLAAAGHAIGDVVTIGEDALMRGVKTIIATAAHAIDAPRAAPQAAHS